MKVGKKSDRSKVVVILLHLIVVPVIVLHFLVHFCVSGKGKKNLVVLKK